MTSKGRTTDSSHYSAMTAAGTTCERPAAQSSAV